VVVVPPCFANTAGAGLIVCYNGQSREVLITHGPRHGRSSSGSCGVGRVIACMPLLPYQAASRQGTALCANQPAGAQGISPAGP
jgi:hypothetical protein